MEVARGLGGNGNRELQFNGYSFSYEEESILDGGMTTQQYERA